MFVLFGRMKIKNKILVLTTTYPTFLAGDGTPPFVHELTKRLVSEDQEMIVLTPRRPGTKSVDYQDGVSIYRYAYFFSPTRELLADGGILPNLKKNKRLYVQIPFLFFFCFGTVLWLISKYKIQVIHAHWIFINGFV